jgi:hypothetical protein
MTRDCARALEVAAALAGGAFDGAEGDLASHARECACCADLVLVMTEFRAERARARREAVVPSAGLVWWRAQLRRRQKAAQAAAAPITALHLLTLGVVLALSAALAWWASASVGASALSIDLSAVGVWFSSPSAGSPALVRYSLALAASTWLVLGPVAVYFMLRKD